MGSYEKTRSKIKTFSNRGFSLLEMAMVLVIVGFITSGLEIGQSVVRNASLKSVISDIEYYKTSIRTFNDTYGGLPGDLQYASVYWPDSLQKSGFYTANGDGNGKIEEYAAQREDLLAWQHLALAGMIKGNYEGAETASGKSLGNIVPESNIRGGGYWIHY